MGLSFSNIHVRMERSLDEALAGRIAEILMRGADAEPVADASEADVMVRVCAGKDSPWVTVLADSIDDDLEEQLLKTRALSEALEARTLAIACSDSDYLCLNLVDAKTKTDIWAAHGKFPFGKAPRRSNPAAWKAYVKDNAHFAQTLRASSVFAENVPTQNRQKRFPVTRPDFAKQWLHRALSPPKAPSCQTAPAARPSPPPPSLRPRQIRSQSPSAGRPGSQRFPAA